MSDAFYTQLAVWSQVAGSLVFIVFVIWIWNKYITPAVLASRDRKNAELAEAEKRRDAAADEVQLAQRELTNSASEVETIRARAVADAQAYRARLLVEAETEGQRVVRNAGGELARGRMAARETLREELVAKALEIARNSARDLDADTNRRLVGEVVASLERGSDA